MSNELKVGDRVTIDGDEFEIMHSIQAPWLQKAPQKSELEKFIEFYCQGVRVNPDVMKHDMKQTALALLKHLDSIVAECVHPAQLYYKACKWCGK